MKLIKTMASSLIAIGLFINQAMAEDYIIDVKGAHASVQFKASHLGYSYVVGRFNTFEGTFSYDESDPSASSVNVTIDATSLDTNHAERDKHLRSSDFLETDTHPIISFVSTSVTPGDENNIAITGDLSIHGITKSVVLDAVHIGNGKDPWGGYRRGFEGTTTLAVENFGLPAWVGEIEITVIAEGIQQ
jgi:polyisoprenoid-binding protein YceI